MLDFPLFPPQASTMAGEVDALYLFLVAVSAFFTLIISASVVYCAVRYRRRSEDEIGSRFHANMLLEVTWTVIPLVIVLFVFFWGAKVFFTQFRPPENAVEMWAIGKQWMWQFQHPDGQREINTLHVPVGQPIKIRMISQDVIHSFFVPAFRVKMDVLPGRYREVWFEATQTGTFHLFCAEYCGAEHSKMIGSVVVLEAEEYERWLAGGAPARSPVEAGADLFKELTCDTCHTDRDSGRGPVLQGLFGQEVELADGTTVVADEAYIRESILQPMERLVAGYQPIMPTYKGQISEENVFRLISYIKSLSATTRRGAGPEEAAAPAATGDER